MHTDDHGQPPPTLNACRVGGRTLDEFIGICRGIVADGEIMSVEGDFLLKWMEANRTVARDWPANVIYERLSVMLIDRRLDLEEQRELFDLIEGLLGGTMRIEPSVESGSTTLPLDVPAPPISFPGASFCLTGKFAFGSRKQVAAAIELRGGKIHEDVVRATRFLVVGAVGSRDWKHATFGNKVLDAQRHRAGGSLISIVSEEHWTAAVQSPPV